MCLQCVSTCVCTYVQYVSVYLCTCVCVVCVVGRYGIASIHNYTQVIVHYSSVD